MTGPLSKSVTSSSPQSPSQKARKRLLHKHLKQRNKLRKYETRVQQALIRKDAALEERAKEDWKNYQERLKMDPESIFHWKGNEETCDDRTLSRCCQLNQGSRFRHLHGSLRSSEERETERVREGSEWLLEFWMQLAPKLKQRSSKREQTIRAAELKANMHKGTQNESMFEDELALLGYTRQKFYERAVLAFVSLDRLDPFYREDNKGEPSTHIDRTKQNHESTNISIDVPIETMNTSLSDSDADEKNNILMNGVWKRLMAIQQVISVGCGPGCDATGVMAFFRSHRVKLKRGILLMDFVIDRWKDLVLNELMTRMVPTHVPVVQTMHCDIRCALDAKNKDGKDPTTNQTFLRELQEDSLCKLVVVSYLLTETRFQWKEFFGDLLSMLQGTESLLLLTEPTAWQLHEFLACFGNEETNFLKAHVWLDSSRDLSHLQSLDKRNGPAILLVCTH